MNYLKFIKDPFYGLKCIKEIIAYYLYNRKRLSKLQILNSLETLDLIKIQRLSVSRYGDGEFSVMRGRGNKFQKPDSRLQLRLREVAASKMNNHLVCMPYALKTTKLLKDCFRRPWIYVAAHNSDMLLTLLHPKQIYGDALITRFYMDYADKTICPDILKKLKALWEEQEICIIEGEKSRIGVSNDLFAKTKSVQRILCPAEDAFSVYEKILNRAIQIPKNKLVLVALGMTATVLTYDLCKRGYWAIDFGHMDIEYEWYRLKATKKVAVTGKYISEVPGGKNVIDMKSIEYERQIIDRISL